MFKIRWTVPADQDMKRLEKDPAKKALVKQIKKVLGYLQVNPKHP